MSSESTEEAWASMIGTETKMRKKAAAKLASLTSGSSSKAAALGSKKKTAVKKKKTTAKKEELVVASRVGQGDAASESVPPPAPCSEPGLPPPPCKAGEDEAELRSGAAPPSAVELLRKLARAVQQLNDDRAASTRLEGLRTLCGVPWAALPQATLEEMLGVLSKPVLRRFEDPVEKHRELAIELMHVLVDQVRDVVPQLAYLFPVLVARSRQAAIEIDMEMNVFVFDAEQHSAYKRGLAVKRPDLQLAFDREMRVDVSEPSETLRLKLCELLVAVMRRTCESTSFYHYLGEVVCLFAGYCRDPFADVQCCALEAMAELCQVEGLQAALVPAATSMARVTLPSLRHRHSRVRVAAVEALHRTVAVTWKAKWRGAGTDAIADLVGFREDNVIPTAAFYQPETSYNYVADLTRDASEKVRFALASALADWFTTLLDRRDHQPRLLAYMLNFAIDESERVRRVALEGIRVAGAEFASEHTDDVVERQQYGVDGDTRSNHDAATLPWPFEARPPLGARLLIRSFSHRIIRPVMDELRNWKKDARRQSAVLLRVIFVYCEEHLTQELHRLATEMCKALATVRREAHVEDREEQRELILACCETLGRYVVPASSLPFFAPRVRGDLEVVPSGANDSGQRADVTDILGAMIRGAKPSTLMPHSHDLVALLADDDVLCGALADETLRRSALNAIDALLTSIGGRGRAALEAAFVTTGRLSSLDAAVNAALRAILALTKEDIKVSTPKQSLATRCLANLAKLDPQPENVNDDQDATLRFVLRRSPKLLADAGADSADEDEDHTDLDAKLVRVLNAQVRELSVQTATAKLGARSKSGLASVLATSARCLRDVSEDDARLADALVGPVTLARLVLEEDPEPHEAITSALRQLHAAALASQADVSNLLLAFYDDQVDLVDKARTAQAARTVLEKLCKMTVVREDEVDTTANNNNHNNNNAVVAHQAPQQRALEACARVVATCAFKRGPRLRPFARENSASLEAESPTSPVEPGAASAAFQAALLTLSKTRNEDDKKAAVRLCHELLHCLRPQEDTRGASTNTLAYADFVLRVADFCPDSWAVVPEDKIPDDFEAHLDGLLRATAILDPHTFKSTLAHLPETNALNNLIDHADFLVTLQKPAAK